MIICTKRMFEAISKGAFPKLMQWIQCHMKRPSRAAIATVNSHTAASWDAHKIVFSSFRSLSSAMYPMIANAYKVLGYIYIKLCRYHVSLRSISVINDAYNKLAYTILAYTISPVHWMKSWESHFRLLMMIIPASRHQLSSQTLLSLTCIAIIKTYILKYNTFYIEYIT